MESYQSKQQKIHRAEPLALIALVLLIGAGVAWFVFSGRSSEEAIALVNEEVAPVAEVAKAVNEFEPENQEPEVFESNPETTSVSDDVNALDEETEANVQEGNVTVTEEKSGLIEGVETEVAMASNEEQPLQTQEIETETTTADTRISNDDEEVATATDDEATGTEGTAAERAIEEVETAVDPENDLKPEVEETVTALLDAEKTEVKEEPKVAQIVPSFDLLRVEGDGSTLVAGRAEPGAAVDIVSENEILGSVVAGSDGSFVAFLDLPKDGQARALALSVGGNEPVLSEKRFLVLPLEEESETAPTIVVADTDRVEVVQASEEAPKETPDADSEETTQLVDANESEAVETQTDIEVAKETKPKAETDQNVEVVLAQPEVPSDLTLDTISYSETGDVVFSGRAGGQGSVRVYVDNVPQKMGALSDGTWRLALPDVDEGIYTVRVDALSAEGEVTARVESPFKRETPDPEALGPEVTVQPGFTLWRLAERKYGSGAKFVQIFEANKNLIKDPNLIYPGQIFDLPE